MSDEAPAPVSPWVFFLLVFALSAPLWLLGSLTDARLLPGLPVSGLMFTCPMIAAVLLAWRKGGGRAAGGVLGRAVDVRRIPSVASAVPALLLFPAILLASWVVLRLSGADLPHAPLPWKEAPALLGMFLVAAASEEVGWSGTALEPLRARFGALGAGLVLGVVTALWHAIPFAQVHPSASWVLGQCLFTLGFRVVLAWMYFHAGRSVFAAVLGHATYNLAWQLFPDHSSGYDPWSTAALTTLAAAALFLGRPPPAARP